MVSKLFLHSVRPGFSKHEDGKPTNLDLIYALLTSINVVGIWILLDGKRRSAMR